MPDTCMTCDADAPDTLLCDECYEDGQLSLDTDGPTVIEHD